MELEQPETLEEAIKEKRQKGFLRTLCFVGLTTFFFIAIVLAAAITYLNSPLDRELPATFTLEQGAGAREVAAELKEQGFVRSEAFFYITLATLFEPTAIKASTYVIDRPLTTVQFAHMLVEGQFGNDLIRFTHIEGQTVEQIATTAEDTLEEFDRVAFLEAALPLEGQLFPDTYFIPQNYTARELVTLLNDSFETAIQPLQADIEKSGLSLDQILILASIVEREANTPESMRSVAGVFQNRLSIGMPLQADASIEYVLDKPLNELTPEDLKIDSPYNTYLNPGLPPTPIGNPGINSIEAVLYPEQNEYFYYITGNDGDFYFSETYGQHLVNIERHLR